jgi:Tfp pilus assembly protein PilF
MELGISSPSVYVGLGNACVRQGKRKEGNEFLRTYAELMSRDKLSGQERYQTLSNQEIKRTAINVFTEAATFYFRAKDIRQTERLLTRCVAIDPSSANGLRALADLYFKTKKLADERLVRERIVELGSTRFSDYLDLAKVCAQMEDREQAEANLKLAINVFPNSIEPIAALAQMLSESGRLDDARWYAQQSLELEPTAAGFRFLAAICKKQQDTQGESEAIQYAIQLESKK